MHQPTVLVVDDDQAMRDFFGASLRLGGFDVRTVADGIAALRAIDERRPDVVLLDLDLPIMNGFAVHEALRTQAGTRELPIVVVSGTGWASPSPVAATLNKPVPADQLITTLFEVLSRAAIGAVSSARQIVWLCPSCRRVIRESQEPGHPMTSEMRLDPKACGECVAIQNERVLSRSGLIDPA
jgi:CheY-like chemotaxis protein